MQLFPSNDQHFLLPGPAGQLEVLTTWSPPSPGQAPRVAIICHPDPRGQGAMQNKVVTTMARAFAQLSLATVRFNFRGVGQSSGEFGEVVGESADLATIIAWVKQVLPGVRLTLAGFSFGSYIAAAAAAQEPELDQLVSIAPPVGRYPFSQLTTITCPWLIVQGDQDELVDYAAVVDFAQQAPVPVQLKLLPGVSHFFHGKLIELRDLLVETLQGIY